MHCPRVPGEAGTRRQHQSTLHRAALQPPGGGGLGPSFLLGSAGAGRDGGAKAGPAAGTAGARSKPTVLGQLQHRCLRANRSAALRSRSGLLGLVALGVQCSAICSLLVWTPSSAGAAPVLRLWSSVVTGCCSSSPAGSLWHRGAHTCFPESPGNSWSEFSRCLARDESFKALAKEFETSPKFAENTY